MNVVLLGAPGAGKGTQAEKISKHFDYLHISTGEILRKAVDQKSDLGKKAKSYMDQGELVPDALMTDLIKEVIPENKDFLLDGFPRTNDQAKVLDQMLKSENKSIHVAINIEVPPAVLIERMLARGRSDDNRQTIERRLGVYEKQTAPLIEYYHSQGKLKSVDGARTVEQVTHSILSILESGV